MLMNEHTNKHANKHDKSQYLLAWHHLHKKAQMTQGLRATAPSLQDGRQPPSWILSNQ